MKHVIHQGNVFDIVPKLKDNSLDCLVTCYDNETDVLTKKGWIPIADVSYEDEIATLNEHTKYLEYQKPESITKSLYTGKMLYISTPYINAKVTPNHRMYIRRSGKNIFDFVDANMLPDKFETKSNCFYEANEIKTVHIPFIPKYYYPECPICNQNKHVRKCGKYVIENEQWTFFRCYSCNKPFYYQKIFKRHSKRMMHKELDFNADDFLEFLGYWVTEGGIDKANTINLTQKNNEVLQKMIDVCKRLSFLYKIYDRKNGVFTIKISCPTLGFYLQKIGKTKDKHIPEEYMSISKRQLVILYKALMCGDGDKVSHRRFWTTSKKLADQFQEILLKIGYSGNIFIREPKERCKSLCYTIGINKIKVTPFVGNSGWNRGRNIRQWIDYDGYVYCVSVPNQIIYVRRGGKPMWCGNSPPYYQLRGYAIPSVIIGGNPECKHEWIESNSTANLKFRGKNSIIGKDADPDTMGNEVVEGAVCKLCGAFFGQLGHEKTPQQFVSNMVYLFDLIRPKLKDTATVFVNIGDTYSQSGGTGSPERSTIHTQFGKIQDIGAYQKPHKAIGYPKKTRLCVPERFATAMVDNGWILRNVLPWIKTNSTPESCNDRFSRKWEYVYFFTKSPDYYFNIHAIKRTITNETIERYKRALKLGAYSINGKYSNGEMGRPTHPPEWVSELNVPTIHKQASLFSEDFPLERKTDSKFKEVDDPDTFGSPRARKGYGVPLVQVTTDRDGPNAIGKDGMGNPWDILIIPSKGIREKHYASFSEALVEYLITAGCPELVCSKCGAPKRQVYDTGGKEHVVAEGCSCNADYTEATIFDPFLGSGTTSMVAKHMNRSSIGIELSLEYVSIAIKRCNFNKTFDDFEVVKE